MSTPAGWYKDIHVTGGERYWDGERWTEQQRDGEGRVPIAQPQPKAAAGWYDDPDLVSTRRYWNGEKWTEHRQEKSTTKAPESATATSGAAPKWIVRGVGIIVVLVAIWVVVGGGWQTITGGTTVNATDLEDSIELDLAVKGVAGVDDLECDDPGRVQRGDRTFCEGTNGKGESVTIQVTFQSDGGYVWETY
jgi:hypothetical protein